MRWFQRLLAADVIEHIGIDTEHLQVAALRTAACIDCGADCICGTDNGEGATEETFTNGLHVRHCLSRFSFIIDFSHMMQRSIYHKSRKFSAAMQKRLNSGQNAKARPYQAGLASSLSCPMSASGGAGAPRHIALLDA
ncbi:hypothetical protein [Rhizobiales bacterium]|uniref:hypothetical protein n=1 Tax=Rhizobium sp. RAF36 TaxID=3233055 RepID=UPI0013AF5E2C